MALFDDDEAIALQELFAGMDAADEASASSAMNKAATFLRQRDLSFRQIVQQIDARGLLLPSKVGAAVQLMDSTTLSEAESALAGARRLMKSCGLTFARVIGALDREPADAEEIDQLRLAYQIEAERSREMEAELQYLRANAAGPGFQPVSSLFKRFVMLATLLFGVFLATSIVSTIADLFRPANATATLRVPATAQPATAQKDNAGRLSASRPNSPCWRDRSINGPCF